jgi:hypothetical protein
MGNLNIASPVSIGQTFETATVEDGAHNEAGNIDYRQEQALEERSQS